MCHLTRNVDVFKKTNVHYVQNLVKKAKKRNERNEQNEKIEGIEGFIFQISILQ